MKKLLIFLMIALPLVIIFVVNFTISSVSSYVPVSVEEITLDHSHIDAMVGDNVSISATIYPYDATNQEILWKSDNGEVATVDQKGNVKFVSYGSGNIIATSVDGGKIAVCSFFINDTVVHRISLFVPKTEIRLGESLQAEATILPSGALNKGVTYMSSDESIASIDANGRISAVGLGYVNLIAVSDEGGFASSVTIAVINPVTALSTKEDVVIVSQNFHNINYSIYPKDASNKSVIFSVSDPSVATASINGVLRFLKVGAVDIVITSVDGGYSASYTVIWTDGYAYELSFEETIIDAKIGDSAIYLNYLVKPSNLYNAEVEFSSDDASVAYVDESGYLQFAGGGSTLIRAKIESMAGEYIEKTISVYVECPAEAIVIENEIYSTEKTYKLNPKSYPNDSTNTSFYYYSHNTNIATVSSDGVVSFKNENYSTVMIDIFANTDLSSIKKTITMFYTAGYPTGFDILNDEIYLDYGDIGQIESLVFPSSATHRVLTYDIVSNVQLDGEGQVVSILSGGEIITLGGGTALVSVSLLSANNIVITKSCQIYVTRKAEDIDIDINLENVDGEYITGINTVSFGGTAYPTDCADRSIIWSIDNKNIAVLLNNTIKFKSTGSIVLTATSTDGNFSKSIVVRFTGTSPISAIVTQINSVWQFGDSADIELLSVFPSNVIYKNLSVRVCNQITNALSGKVLVVSGNSVSAVGGGTACLIISVSNTVQMIYNITVVRDAESISVDQSNIVTTKESLSLTGQVLPIDASNKTIIYQVLNEDVAFVQDETLFFHQNGIAQIVASCGDVVYNFTIEKVAKGTINIPSTSDELEMLLGETYSFDSSSDDYEYEIILNETLFEEGNVVSVTDDGTVTAALLGNATIACSLYDSYGTLVKYRTVQIHVIQLAQSIDFVTDLELLNDEYITAESITELAFEFVPLTTTYKTCDVIIIGSYLTSGEPNSSITYIENSNLYFSQAGVAILKVTSTDKNASLVVRIRYTGGDAISATLNLENSLTLNVGESFTFDVVSWLPSNTINKNIVITEISHSLDVDRVINIVEHSITAVNGGISKISIKLSSGIVKNVNITVVKKITEIRLEKDVILTAESRVTILASIIPSDATNRNLIYTLSENSIASLVNRTVTFSSPGTVIVSLTSTDGSNIVKTCEITSTMGYLNFIELNLSSRIVNKGSFFNLIVTKKLPADALYSDVGFEIIDSCANDGSDNSVISVNADGRVDLLYGGDATVRAYAYDYFGNIVYTDCAVKVIASVTSIEVVFNENIEYSQSSIITSKSVYSYSGAVYPIDATDKTINTIVEKPDIAFVEDGYIHFIKEGKTRITFIAYDISNGEKSVSFSLYYTAGKVVKAQIDLTDFNEKTLTLNAGEKYEICVNSFSPVDITDVSVSFAGKTEMRNDESLQVVELSNNIISTLNGGEAKFHIYVNELDLGEFTVIVVRNCDYIDVESEDIIFSSIRNYSIIAKVMPSDCTDNELEFSSSDDLIATVSESGDVTFIQNGSVEILIKLKNNPQIYHYVTIQYSNILTEIYFSETKDYIFITENLTLIVNTRPATVDPYEIEFASSDESIATVSAAGKITPKDKEGFVTIYAKVVGTQIIISKTFEIIRIVEDIQLELDESGDSLGIGGYRVFGTKFLTKIEETLTESSEFAMNISSISPSNTELSKLIWFSSDENVATVDEFGIVTILTSGKVTISVAPYIQHSQQYPLIESYEFTFVDGINVYDCEQFEYAIKNVKNIVMQEKIEAHAGANWAFVKNLYGNGNILLLTNASTENGKAKLNILRDDVIIDNVIFRGCEYDSSTALSTLENKKNVLTISSSKNVIIKNSIIENGDKLVIVLESEVIFMGCIIRNSSFAGITIAKTSNTSIVSVVTIKDCIFGRNLLGCILFDKDESTEANRNTLIVEGRLEMYNWITVDEMVGNRFDEYMDAKSQINEVLKNYSDYKYSYNGKDYYLLGILHPKVNILGLVNYDGRGIINTTNISPETNYIPLRAQGTTTVISLPVNYDIMVYTLLGSTTFIRPWDTFGDISSYARIRQAL